MEAVPRTLRIFRSKNGLLPFSDWFFSLVDLRARQKIASRLARVRAGNLGNLKSVGDGIQELKIDYGPGFRIYIGQLDSEIIILLCGGDKGSQNADIKKAKVYWKEYKKEQEYVEY